MSSEMANDKEAENVSPSKQEFNAEHDAKDEEMNDSDVQSSNTDESTLNNSDNNASKMPAKEKVIFTPAIQKLRKGLAEFDVRSPSDAMMSPVTAKLSQVRHTMKQSDAIRRGNRNEAPRIIPQQLNFEDDEDE